MSPVPASGIPWLEKYRPNTLADVVGNTDAVDRLRVIAKHGNLPNILLSGPPGTGKTSAIQALARELLGDKVKEAVLELNASDERGIDVVRSTIIEFARRHVSLPSGRTKLIILDEVDSMTSAAQQALRRTMELYAETTRFALACNRPSRVIEPIQSRCAILRFGQLEASDIAARLACIAQLEHITIEPAALRVLQVASNGDLRSAVNALQSCAARGEKVVTRDIVLEVVDMPQPERVKAAIDAVRDGKTREAIDAMNQIYQEGYSLEDMLSSMFMVITEPNAYSEALQLKWVRAFSSSHVAMVQGISSWTQLSGLIGKLVLEASLFRAQHSAC